MNYAEVMIETNNEKNFYHNIDKDLLQFCLESYDQSNIISVQIKYNRYSNWHIYNSNPKFKVEVHED